MVHDEKYIRVLLSVAGLVQGVGFRFWTRTHARGLGLGGYVRNLPDRRVEVLLEGDRSAVEEMMSLLRQGPYPARVDRLIVENRQTVVSFSPVFEITR